MDKINFSVEQVNHIVDILTTTTYFEIFQLVISSVTVVALIITVFYQRKTMNSQKDTVDILIREERLKQMPYFKLVIDEGNNEIFVQPHQTFNFPLELKNNIAYDVKFEVLYSPFFLDDNTLNHITQDTVDIGEHIEVGEYNFDNNGTATIASENTIISLLRIKYTDFFNRNYEQIIYLKDTRKWISKPKFIK